MRNHIRPPGRAQKRTSKVQNKFCGPNLVMTARNHLLPRIQEISLGSCPVNSLTALSPTNPHSTLEVVDNGNRCHKWAASLRAEGTAESSEHNAVSVVETDGASPEDAQRFPKPLGATD